MSEAYQTLAGEPCNADWQALQNLCDIHGLELRENRYNGLGEAGYTMILRTGVKTHSAHIPYYYTLPEVVEWVEKFCENHKQD